MELYQRQQFDLLLQAAVERYVERLEQRNQGPEEALKRLRQNPSGEGIWLPDFVDAVFEDFLLKDGDGAAFILRALASKPLPKVRLEGNQTIEHFLLACARAAFMELLRQKTEEYLEMRACFHSLPASAD